MTKQPSFLKFFPDILNDASYKLDSAKSMGSLICEQFGRFCSEESKRKISLDSQSKISFTLSSAIDAVGEAFSRATSRCKADVSARARIIHEFSQDKI